MAGTKASRRKAFKAAREALDYQKQHPRLTIYYISSGKRPDMQRPWVVCIRQPAGADIAVPALSIDDPNIRYRMRTPKRVRSPGDAVIEVYTHGQLYLQYPISQDSPALRRAIGTFLRPRISAQRKQAARAILRVLSSRRSS